MMVCTCDSIYMYFVFTYEVCTCEVCTCEGVYMRCQCRQISSVSSNVTCILCVHMRYAHVRYAYVSVYTCDGMYMYFVCTYEVCTCEGVHM